MLADLDAALPLPPAGTATDRDVVDALHLLALARAEIEDRIRTTIDDARYGAARTTAAVTWAEIGDALGVTRSAAQQRYGS